MQITSSMPGSDSLPSQNNIAIRIFEIHSMSSEIASEESAATYGHEWAECFQK